MGLATRGTTTNEETEKRETRGSWDIWGKELGWISVKQESVRRFFPSTQVG